MQASLSESAGTRLAKLLAVRGVTTANARWAVLDGGRTNQSWRVTDGSRQIVIKLFAQGAENPLFPNDPAREIQALRHLQGHDLAPRLVDHFATPLGQCVIYEHLHGVTWKSDTAKVAQVLKRLHRLDAPEGLRATPDGSLALRHQAERILQSCAPSGADWAQRLMPKAEVAPIGAACLLHGDPVPGNIIGDSRGLWLIDWQCPGVGDPCEDIAIFLSPAMQLAYRGKALAEGEKQTFLDAYDDAKVIKRYTNLAPWYHWRMLAYCLWQTANGDPQADIRAKAEARALETG
ncbi:phosphotransferase [uncultured Roseovarius sp.]|uniref:phosphotransferase n=1 Tax=Roseovarius sp. TaxID=1486281 RepID=UPI0025EAF6B0|nr:phosphotransferase [uncultured Roseovarius sp.]